MFRSSALLMGLLLTLNANHAAAATPTLMVHGSGTTNPEKCYASIIEKFSARAKVPIRMTYRSVGSSTGLAEFENNFESPIVDFASGEIPLSSESWQKFKDQNVTVLHLPALFGAVSFFHSVPSVHDMNLTACLLARIFTRDIKDWSHPDILAENPEMKLDGLKSKNGTTYINVAVRENGSGNTLAITEYLHKACPEHFPTDMVSALPSWPLDAVAARGNGGLLAKIQSTPGTIGYLEAGSGILARLPEVSLTNKYGRTLNSEQAAAYNGIGAEEEGVLPEDPSADFGQVSLLDQRGEFTWPITLVTYIYVRMDLSFMPDPEERSLLIAFLKALYDPEFVDVCATNYGFTLADGVAYDLAQRAITMLEESLGDKGAPWTFEYKPRALVGTGDYVISTTRMSLPQDERHFSLESYNTLREDFEALQQQVNLLIAGQAGMVVADNEDEVEFTEEEKVKITAGLVMGTVGVFIALIALILPFSHVHEIRC